MERKPDTHKIIKYRMHDCNISGINRRITFALTRLIEKWDPHKNNLEKS